jgi:hypothetical protein
VRQAESKTGSVRVRSSEGKKQSGLKVGRVKSSEGKKEGWRRCQAEAEEQGKEKNASHYLVC